MLRAAAATAVVALGGVGYAELTSGAGIPGFLPAPPAQTEQPSDADRQQRLQAFAAQGPLALRVVERANAGIAVDSMNLAPQARSALRHDLDAGDVAAGAPADSVAVSPSPAPSGAPAVRAAPSRSALQLAWITLWDTDVEDGDVVRIDAQGYSRTQVLTKRGTTFAIPVPADGIITVTGVKDGDGGGITVGLASGGVAAVFPIMSTGQTLGLSVTVK